VQTKDGAIQYKDWSDGARPEEFAALLERTRYKLGQLADGILDGDILVAPYRLGRFSPCNWCSFREVCRFEFGQGSLRILPGLKRTEVLAELVELNR
jgi:ATP-dependent helicase/nuclease subunit B